MGQLDDIIIYSICGIVISTSFTIYEVEVEESDSMESLKHLTISGNLLRVISVNKRDLLKQQNKSTNVCNYVISWGALLSDNVNKEMSLTLNGKVF
jgi:hypothetical protein